MFSGIYVLTDYFIGFNHVLVSQLDDKNIALY